MESKGQCRAASQFQESEKMVGWDPFRSFQPTFFRCRKTFLEIVPSERWCAAATPTRRSKSLPGDPQVPGMKSENGQMTRNGASFWAKHMGEFWTRTSEFFVWRKACSKVKNLTKNSKGRNWCPKRRYNRCAISSVFVWTEISWNYGLT